MIQDKPIEELTKTEIIEALSAGTSTPVNTLDESIDELKAMGIRDISDVDIKASLDEAMKNIQIQKTLQDLGRGSTDKKSVRDYLEHHIKFLHGISPGKTIGDVAKSMTVEHAQAVLTTTAKMSNVDEDIIKKHLKTLKKKYN